MAGGGGGGQPGLILMTSNTGALYHQYCQYWSNTGAKKVYGRIISRLFHGAQSISRFLLHHYQSLPLQTSFPDDIDLKRFDEFK